MEINATVYGPAILDDLEGICQELREKAGIPETTYVLSDEHAASSYGVPVLLIDGVPHSWTEAAGRGIYVHCEASVAHWPTPGLRIGSPEIREEMQRGREWIARWDASRPDVNAVAPIRPCGIEDLWPL